MSQEKEIDMLKEKLDYYTLVASDEERRGLSGESDEQSWVMV